MRRAAALAPAALALLLAGPPARADEPMGPAEFRDYAEGWTLHFELDGRVYGAEQYLPGQRSLWRFGEEGCERGVWFGEGEAICFSYETNPGPLCWLVYRRGGDIFARLRDVGPEGGELRVSRRDRAPLHCPGPSVGV